MSLIEQQICSPDFPYLQPYFYNHPYALRCELGLKQDSREYMETVRERAFAIYRILFPEKADAFIFDYYINDYSFSDEADESRYPERGFDEEDKFLIEEEMQKLRFLLQCQHQYRHIAVKKLPTYEEDVNSPVRNRIVCFADEKKIDAHKLIERQINEIGYEIGLVSFKNECILSVYDDRGCDVVFATQEKLREFYPRLLPYLLEYDAAEMKKRYEGQRALSCE